MTRRILSLALWIVLRLAPPGEREALLGDLVEEQALRASDSSAPAALRWCLRQACASVMPLMASASVRSAWISTAGVALLAYAAVGVVEVSVHWAIAGASARRGGVYGGTGYGLLDLLLTFPFVTLIGYCATALRPIAPVVVGAMMLAAVTLMTISSHENVPAWYHAAYFFAGPLAMLIGRVCHSRRHARP